VTLIDHIRKKMSKKLIEEQAKFTVLERIT